MERKERVAKWAKRILADKNAIILDTETTGLDGSAEVVEIAIVRSDGHVLMDTLIKPYDPIPARATAIHGISDEMVLDAPTWAEAQAEISRIIGRASVVVIYNQDYDWRVMQQSADKWGLQNSVDYRLLFQSSGRFLCNCAMKQYAVWYGDWNDYHRSYRWQKLGDAASRFGVDPGDAHRALADCKLTLEVLRGLASNDGAA